MMAARWRIGGRAREVKLYTGIGHPHSTYKRIVREGSYSGPTGCIALHGSSQSTSQRVHSSRCRVPRVGIPVGPKAVAETSVAETSCRLTELRAE
jgi:hypothetical protein